MKEKAEHSSENLYADLSYKNAEKMEAKAVLAREIYRIITRKNLSQSKAATLLGIPQGVVALIGKFNHRAHREHRGKIK